MPIAPSKKLNIYTLRLSRFGARRITVLAASRIPDSRGEARDELNSAAALWRAENGDV